MIIFSYSSIGGRSKDFLLFSGSLLKLISSTSLNSEDLVLRSSMFSSSNFVIYFWALYSLMTKSCNSSSLVMIFYFNAAFSSSSWLIYFMNSLWSADDYRKNDLLLSFPLSLSFSLYLSLCRSLSRSFYRSFCLSISILSSFSISFFN